MIGKRIIAILTASVAFLGVGGTVAEAAAPVSGSGDFQVTFVPTGVETADGNTFITFTVVETFTGFLDGTRVGQGSLVVHPDGNLTARDSGIFKGTIAGSAPGTLTMNVEVSGSFSAATGQGQAGDGTGGLTDVVVNLVAHGHAVGPTSLAGNYVAQVQTANG